MSVSLWTSNTRDAALFFVAAFLLVFEVLFGGARSHVLAMLTGLLLAPVGLKIDRARRENGGGVSDRQ